MRMHYACILISMLLTDTVWNDVRYSFIRTRTLYSSLLDVEQRVQAEGACDTWKWARRSMAIYITENLSPYHNDKLWLSNSLCAWLSANDEDGGDSRLSLFYRCAGPSKLLPVVSRALLRAIGRCSSQWRCHSGTAEGGVHSTATMTKYSSFLLAYQSWLYSS